MIIPVTKENEKQWAELCVALWPDGHTTDSFIRERCDGGLANEFLFILNNEPVAFISLSIRHDYVEGTDSSPVGYIEGIYVKPEHRKHGIARQLVEFGKRWSAEKGCSEYASDCLIENEDSRKFHNKVGFKEANVCVHFTMSINSHP